MKPHIVLRAAASLLVAATLACNLTATESTPVDATSVSSSILTQTGPTAEANQPSPPAVMTGTPVVPTNANAPPTNTNPPPTFTRTPSPTFTRTPLPTFTRTPLPLPTFTFTPVPPTFTFTPVPPTITPTFTPTVPAAPAAPSNFSAVGGGATIDFLWDDNSLNETGFRIYQVGGASPVVSPPAHTASGGASYYWTGRPCNVSATFVIRAYNDAGESASSNSSSAVTIPCAPTNLSASGYRQSSISLRFTDNATNETGFRIYRSGTVFEWRASSGTGPVMEDDGGLTCGQTYIYKVRAYNSAGESAPSNEDDGTSLACTVTVNFTSVYIYNDEDPSGSGELWFDFNVNGQTRRWPTSGTVTASTGNTKTISGISVTLSLMRTTNLTITVKGTDSDSPPLDPNDSLGTVSVAYSGSSNWSKGSHCVDSTSPKDFRICYTITVTP